MYKLFVDDSWNKTYINPYDEKLKYNLPEWKDENIKWLDNNFFSLCWIHIETSKIKELNSDINQLKIKYFWTKEVEIKSTFLRSPKNREKYYLKPYWISNENLNLFWEEIYNILEKHKENFLIYWVVFDKRQYKYRKDDNSNILLKSSQALFERIEKSWKQTKIVFDQMDKSLVKTTWDNWKILQILKWENKNIIRYNEKFENIIDIEFQKSNNENMLQLADLVAYNIRRQYMQFWSILIDNPDNIKEVEDYPYFAKICKNIYKNEEWKYIWYWLVIFPNFKKIDWRW